MVAGNPAKVIMSIESYYKKRKEVQLKEASELVRLYRERYNREPDEKALHEFFWLFCNEEDELSECFAHMMNLVGNREQSCQKLKENKKIYKNMDDFLQNVR